MRFDTIIAGGGLGGLVSGIVLARAGERVAIISSGKSALHFCSGSLELWSGTREEFDSLAERHPSHPYLKVGLGRLARYDHLTRRLFGSAGIPMVGGVDVAAERFATHHYRLSPIGALKPAWLTMEEYVTFPSEQIEGKVLIVGIEGYLDFYPEFIAHALRGRGAECRTVNITMPRLEALRESPTEMRAVAIARVLKGEALEELARRIEAGAAEGEMVLLPAVFGMASGEEFARLEGLLSRPVKVAPTVSASVPGVRMQRLLSEEFQRLGGEYILGDKVTSCTIEDGRLERLRTVNHNDIELSAKNFILATGSFFGRGLVATPEAIVEPILGLDVEASGEREEWCSERILDPQPFQRYGVTTDGELHPTIEGRRIENLYAVGSVLAGADPVKEGCGAGVTVATALMAAEAILSREVSPDEWPEREEKN